MQHEHDGLGAGVQVQSLGRKDRRLRQLQVQRRDLPQAETSLYGPRAPLLAGLPQLGQQQGRTGSASMVHAWVSWMHPARCDRSSRQLPHRRAMTASEAGATIQN